MHRSKAAVAAALLTVLVLLPLAVAPVAAGDSKDKAKAEHERIVKYWTAERIASAKPRDFVRTNEGKFVPKAKPAARGGGVVKGASWTGGGPVVQRTGKVLFTMDGGNWVCSASAIADGRGTHSLILTAGHCAYDEVNKEFATNWTYVPSYDTAPTFSCGQNTYGCWTATSPAVAGSSFTAATPTRRVQYPGHDPRLRDRDRRGRWQGHPARCPRDVRHRLSGDLDRWDRPRLRVPGRRSSITAMT